eukprot:4121343-Amphidinium_carterae.1
MELNWQLPTKHVSNEGLSKDSSGMDSYDTIGHAVPDRNKVCQTCNIAQRLALTSGFYSSKTINHVMP